MSAHLKALRQVDPVLTQLAIGYRQATFIGEQVMPVVNVEKEGIRVPAYGKASFVEYQTERAPHAASNVMTLDKATMLPVQGAPPRMTRRWLRRSESRSS